MTSEPIRDPLKDHLLTPQNSAFIIIDYQPIQVSSIRSMNQEELVFNIVHTTMAAVNYNLPIVHSTVNVKSGKNKPPIKAIMDVLGSYPTIDRTTINSWEDVDFNVIGRVLKPYQDLWMYFRIGMDQIPRRILRDKIHNTIALLV